jgi:hypothetical protein
VVVEKVINFLFKGNLMELKSKSMIFVALAVVLTAGCAQVSSNSKANRPNIIFVLVDDMGYGDAGFTGQKYIKTPNIDAWLWKEKFSQTAIRALLFVVRPGHL